MADIPGLIEGAHEGAGLGTRFLGHVERCRALLHLVDGTEDDIAAAYKTVRGELKAYGGNLARKKEIVALNKTDAMTPEDIETKRAQLAKASRKAVHVISGVSGQGVQALLHELMKLVDKQRVSDQGSGVMSRAGSALASSKRLVVKIGSSILVDEAKGQIRARLAGGADRRRRAPAQGRLRGRARLVRRDRARPHLSQAAGRRAASSRRARPPPRPARSSSRTPTRKRSPGTASPWRRSC